MLRFLKAPYLSRQAYKMNRYTITYILSLLLVGCPDPPLLKTPLPNNYSFNSNGGEFGNIKNEKGKRLSEYFGILSNGKEKWCTDFAWENNFVICKLIQYSNSGFKPKSTEYFIINTTNGKIRIFPTESTASSFWKKTLHTKIPEMKRKYPTTRKR